MLRDLSTSSFRRFGLGSSGRRGEQHPFWTDVNAENGGFNNHDLMGFNQETWLNILIHSHMSLGYLSIFLLDWIHGICISNNSMVVILARQWILKSNAVRLLWMGLTNQQLIRNQRNKDEAPILEDILQCITDFPTGFKVWVSLQCSSKLISGWWFGTFFYFSIILGFSSSQLTFIFFRGVGIPPSRHGKSTMCGSFHSGKPLDFHISLSLLEAVYIYIYPLVN